MSISSTATSACPWAGLSSLSSLAVVDEPEPLCRVAGGWRESVAQLDHPPIWQISGHAQTLELTPRWTSQCEDGRSQCRRGGRLRYCVLQIPDAMVMENGLVLNRTHRFRLAKSYHTLTTYWNRPGFGPFGLIPGPPSCSKLHETPRVLYSFRQLYGENPWHVLLQVLPLFAPVLDEIRTDPATRVLASGSLMKRMLLAFLPAERVIYSDKPIASEQVRLVVGAYEDGAPFSARTHVFSSGCLSALRQLQPRSETVKSERPVLLFVPRTLLKVAQGTRHAGVGVRAIGNMREVLQRASQALIEHNEQVLARGTSALSLEAAFAPKMDLLVYEFNKLTEQAKAFSRARIVVGPDGTAFSGLAFSRPGVAVVQWSFEREGAALFSNYLFHNGARFFKLWPRWRQDPTNAVCNSSRLPWNGCPWFLLPADIEIFIKLLRHLLHDGGSELIARFRPSNTQFLPMVRPEAELRQALKESQVYVDSDGTSVKLCYDAAQGGLSPRCVGGDRAVDAM